MKNAWVALAFAFGIFAFCAEAQAQSGATKPIQSSVWVDPATHLMWTNKDNGSEVDREHAIAYCSSLRLGGNSNWRLPNSEELSSIFDSSSNFDTHDWRVKGGIEFHGSAWSSTPGKDSGEVWDVSPETVGTYLIDSRVLCVRNAGTGVRSANSTSDAVHRTVGGSFSLFGLRGGIHNSAVTSILGKPFSARNCHLNAQDMTTECTVALGTTRVELTFFQNRLGSFHYYFPVSDWSSTQKFFTNALHGEPTDIDRLNQEAVLTWKSTASSPCLLNPEKRCPDETLIVQRNEDSEAQAIYLYMPVYSEQIRANAARSPQR